MPRGGAVLRAPAVLALAVWGVAAVAALGAPVGIDGPAWTRPASLATGPEDPGRLADRARRAAVVLGALAEAPEGGIPRWLLRRARCVAVIPKLVKVGFILGGRHGKGLVSCRTGAGWSPPSFVSLSGGSVGLQVGAQATDLVFVFVEPEAARHLAGGRFTLGGDASVSAGPLGRTAEAATDIRLDAEIYSYSRSRGLFVGISVEGATLRADHDANRAVYGRRVLPEELLLGTAATVPGAVAPFLEALERHAPDRQPSAGAAAPAPAPIPGPRLPARSAGSYLLAAFARWGLGGPSPRAEGRHR